MQCIVNKYLNALGWYWCTYIIEMAKRDQTFPQLATQNRKVFGQRQSHIFLLLMLERRYVTAVAHKLCDFELQDCLTIASV